MVARSLLPDGKDRIKLSAFTETARPCAAHLRGNPMKNPKPVEYKCSAYHGTAFPAVTKPLQPGRRIYPWWQGQNVKGRLSWRRPLTKKRPQCGGKLGPFRSGGSRRRCAPDRSNSSTPAKVPDRRMS